MPRYKRWFNVDQDINHKPKMRELMRAHGLSGFRIWLEILSIGNRNDGEVDCWSVGALSRLTSAADTKQKVTTDVLLWLQKRNSIAPLSNYKGVMRIVNHAKYNILREAKENPPGNQSASPPNLPNPNLPDKSKNKNKNPPKAPLPIPSWLNKTIWKSYLEMRKKIRKPATDDAMAGAIKRLTKLKETGEDPNAILEQSIFNSWQGIFPLKNIDVGKRTATGAEKAKQGIKETLLRGLTPEEQEEMKERLRKK